ncbi:MAG: hypothetical protein KBI07_03860 [Candidatus Atribacteria bacterium]|nr:hypothetical protein [Candidatus Atribacteria bacterium]
MINGNMKPDKQIFVSHIKRIRILQLIPIILLVEKGCLMLNKLVEQ